MSSRVLVHFHFSAFKICHKNSPKESISSMPRTNLRIIRISNRGHDPTLIYRDCYQIRDQGGDTVYLYIVVPIDLIEQCSLEPQSRFNVDQYSTRLPSYTKMVQSELQREKKRSTASSHR